MLVFVALTFPVGPSIVLILLGLLAGLQLCFVTNPSASVGTKQMKIDLIVCKPVLIDAVAPSRLEGLVSCMDG